MELHPRHCIVSKGKTLNTGQHIAQSVTCLATDVCLTSDPGVTSSIRVPYFHEIDHDIISMGITLPSSESFKKGCCQLQAEVCARSNGKMLVQACPVKMCLGELAVPT